MNKASLRSLILAAEFAVIIAVQFHWGLSH